MSFDALHGALRHRIWQTWLVSGGADSVQSTYLNWLQSVLDQQLADVFGANAVQLGLPQVSALRANRMQHRWQVAHPYEDAQAVSPSTRLVCSFEALPFPDESLDLVVMPHALDLAEDPHRVLTEAYRVLRPHGHIWLCGVNPSSLWGWSRLVSQAWAQLRGQDVSSRLQAQWQLLVAGQPLNSSALLAVQPVGLMRLRDWLRLLNCDIHQGCFGQYTPAQGSGVWQQRWSWLNLAGDRWWPMLGGVYVLMATKQVPAVRVLSATQRLPKRAAVRLAPALRDELRL